MKANVFTHSNLMRLTREERAELMRLQMSPSYGRKSVYLPDGTSSCGACGEPILGSGWCVYCLDRFDGLVAKAKGETR